MLEFTCHLCLMSGVSGDNIIDLMSGSTMDHGYNVDMYDDDRDRIFCVTTDGD